jgi:hypothetical protein
MFLVRFIKWAFLAIIQTVSRLLSTYVYLFPFLEVYIHLSPYLMSQKLLTPFLEEWALDVREDQFINILLYGLSIYASRKVRIPYLLRFHSMQALFIILIIGSVDPIAYFMSNMPGDIMGEDGIGFPIYNIFCFGILWLIIYCAYFAFIGKVTKLPVFTLVVNSAIQPNLQDKGGNKNEDKDE